MLFNSYTFILLFLPTCLAGYFLIQAYLGSRTARLFLLTASLGFVAFWNFYFVLILTASILFNYAFGSAIRSKTLSDTKRKKAVFIAAVAANILFLGFFKYSNFFLLNINTLFSQHFRPLQIMLPLGISFYTFMQIAWLTDMYRNGTFKYNFFDYCLYVMFFPYVASGPITYHNEMLPQLMSEQTRFFNPANASKGLFLFAVGLFKKVAIADTLAIIADGGFNAANSLTFTEAWLTSLSYTMQLYFDFSGYTDMAIGVALMFNIHIPANFNSPYRSLSIQEFWQRWHITLSRFLRNYIYIPLGGNRSGEMRTLVNLMLTFLIGGLWHGAAWTFVFWGFLHGLALCVHRLWKKTGIRLSKIVAWLLTFNFINIAWIFFRTPTLEDAFRILKGMMGLNGILVSPGLSTNPLLQKLTVIGIRFGEWRANLPETENLTYFLCIILIPFVLLAKNSGELLTNFSPNWKTAIATVLMFACGLLLLNNSPVFLYFKF